MPYHLLLTRDIKKQIEDLPGTIRAIAPRQIANLINDLRPPRSQELSGRSQELSGHSGHHRLHLSSRYRLVWRMQEEERVIEIEYVGPKSPDLYEKLGLAGHNLNRQKTLGET